MPEISFSQLIAGLVFGSVGFVCFVYGKKQNGWKPMVAGAALMGLPYVLRQAVWLWVGGALILAALYVFRD